MSGICGIFASNKAPVSHAALAAMTSVLEQRGPDGTRRWHEEAVGLGHTLLTTTLSSRNEPQLYQHAESGCVVTADARLDYRDELIDALRIEKQRQIGDAELILKAYLAWGEPCLDRLYGDFAFAIRDPRHDLIFCARDRFAARPFYYHHTQGKHFVFASDVRAILVLPEIPFAINEGRIAEFLVQELEWADYTSTFYKDVYRLPPAHKARITSRGLHVSEYWSAEPGPGLGLATDEEYRGAFLELFSRAVAERSRVPGSRAGSMLSGGMDSGAIVAVAQGTLEPFSLAHNRGVDCVESKRIYATLEFLGLRGTQVIVDQPENLSDELIADLREPFDGEFLFLKAIYGAAKRDGTNVVLDGAAGDIVFNEGPYVIRLLRRGRFQQAWRETVGIRAFWGAPPPVRAFVRHIGSAFVPAFAQRPIRKAKVLRDERGFVKASLISPAFAARIDISQRFERMRETFAMPRTDDPALERISKLRPNLTAGRERYARIAASVGVEGRDPFTDQRVVEFCANLPDHLCARDGWPKFLLRDAMAGRLPDEVRWGRGKPHIGGLYNQHFLVQQELTGNLHLNRLQDLLKDYVEESALRAAWQEFKSGRRADTVYSAYLLSQWLQQSVTRPVVKDQGFR